MGAPVSARPWLVRLFPFLAWLGLLRRDQLRPDLEAGFIGAVLILPQAIALATLAGMPPEYGIYTSIIPVVIASLWGSSFHMLSGPNTAVCVLIASSVAPFAGVGTADYIGFVLALTLMAGVVELLVGLLRFGSLLDFISQTVISAIVLAVGLVIIVSAAAPFLGVLSNLYEPFPIRLYQSVQDIGRANPYAVAVGAATVLTGLVARRFWRRYALVAAVAAGSLGGVLLNLLYGPATTGIELLGRLSLSALPLSVPTFEMESLAVLKELVASAFSIAFLGLMQTIVIARALGARSGQTIDTNQEIVAQGLSNIVAPFFSSFAGSGSFNRSGAHYEAGARTPLAALYASLFLALAVFAGAPLIVYLPTPAVAGALVLVGWGLIDLKEFKKYGQSRHEAVIFYATLGVALLFGLNAGVFTGVLLSLVIYLWFASTPTLLVEEQIARDGRPVHAVTINGNLFFGAVHYVESILSRLTEQEGEKSLLLVRTDHLTYLDHPGAAMLAAEARRRRENGSALYLYVTRPELLRMLRESGYLSAIGEGNVIERDRDHPMKALLLPYSVAASPPPRRSGSAAPPPRRLPARVAALETAVDLRLEPDLIGELAVFLGGCPLLSAIPGPYLERMLKRSRLQLCAPGSAIVPPGELWQDFLVVLEGEVEVHRYWRDEGGVEKALSERLNPADGTGVFAPGSSAERATLAAVTGVRYLFLDGDLVEEAISQGGQLAATGGGVRQPVSAFAHLPPENLEEAYRRLQRRLVKAGDVVIRQGDPGDAYFLIDKGEAEVVRTDPFSQQTQTLAIIGPGDSFGEEALLQNVTRNATIRMLGDGELLVLDRRDFDQLVKSTLVQEIDADQALRRVEQGQARWLDCRFELEYRAARLPGAQLLPLDRIRDGIDGLDPEARYIVYCRTGRRSAAAAFLLRARRIDAVSLRGGLRNWPYDLDKG